MKKHRKNIIALLTILLCLSLIVAIKSLAASGSFRYIIVEYINSTTNEHIKQTYTVPVLVDSSGKGTYELMPAIMQVSEYNFISNNEDSTLISGYIDVNGKLVRINSISSKITIAVGDNNTIDNPINVKLYFKPVDKSIPVFAACVYQYPNSNPPDTYMSPANYTILSSGSLNATYTLDPADSPLGKYTNVCKIKYEYTLGVPVDAPSNAGTIAGGKIVLNAPPAGVQKIDIYYYYAAKVATSAELAITVIDNFIDPSTGKAVTLSDGRDYIGRKDYATKKYNLNDTITVESPSKGITTLPGFDDPSQLTLNKVVYESGQGNPVNALLPQYQYVVTDGTLIDKTDYKGYFLAEMAPLRQYIHYYWNVTPGSGNGTPPDPPPVTSEGIPPTATISAPSTVIMGDDCYIAATGHSQDPKVESLSGTIVFTEGITVIPKESTLGNQISWGGAAVFPAVGTYHAKSIVTDNNGLSGTSQEVTINVTPPIPVVHFVQSGTQKENRKVSIDATSSFAGSSRCSIDWTKATWEVTALSGGTNSDIRVQRHTEGETNGEILIDSSRGKNDTSLTGDIKSIDLLFKKAGDYKVKVNLTNSLGYSGSNEITLTIKEDLPPIADTFIPGTILRDPKDKTSSGKAQATIEINSSSKSIDGDTLSKVGYVMSFDSNNDKIFDDEITYIYDLKHNGSNQIPNNDSINPHLRPIVKYKDLGVINIDDYNTGANDKCIIKSTHVGKYRVAVIVKEQFGQPTIPQFVTSADRRTANNFD